MNGRNSMAGDQKRVGDSLDTNQHPPVPATPATRDRLNDRTDYQLCYVCGARNRSGLGLVFHQEGEEVVAEFTADARYQGFPGVIHGGIVATLLDETLERIGTLEGRWLMTGRLEVRYRRVAPINRELRVSARLVSSRPRALVACAKLAPVDAPEAIIAEAQGTFLPLPPNVQRQVAAAYPVFARAFDEPPSGE
jgi:acyl-coenzyme A thioesterase PaaI-like protein